MKNPKNFDLRLAEKSGDLAALGPSIVNGDRRNLLVGLAKVVGGESAASVADALLAWRSKNDRAVKLFVAELEREERAEQLAKLVAKFVILAVEGEFDNLQRRQHWLADQLDEHADILSQLSVVLKKENKKSQRIDELERLVVQGALAEEIKEFLGSRIFRLAWSDRNPSVLLEFLVADTVVDMAIFNARSSICNSPGEAWLCMFLDAALGIDLVHLLDARERLEHALARLRDGVSLGKLLAQREDYRVDGRHHGAFYIRGAIYGGRRCGFKKATLENLQKLNAENVTVSVLTYDSLLEQLRQGVGIGRFQQIDT